MRATARSRAITANGFVGRCLHSRSWATAAPSSARQASWNPPSPLTATITPRSNPSRASLSASAPRAITPDPGPSSHSRGPHAGQHTGSAWKRRSAGSAYSRAQSGQSGKHAIEVRSRSYGSAVARVKRGPQFVQVVNG